MLLSAAFSLLVDAARLTRRASFFRGRERRCFRRLFHHKHGKARHLSPTPNGGDKWPDTRRRVLPTTIPHPEEEKAPFPTPASPPPSTIIVTVTVTVTDDNLRADGTAMDREEPNPTPIIAPSPRVTHPPTYLSFLNGRADLSIFLPTCLPQVMGEKGMLSLGNPPSSGLEFFDSGGCSTSPPEYSFPQRFREVFTRSWVSPGRQITTVVPHHLRYFGFPGVLSL